MRSRVFLFLSSCLLVVLPLGAQDKSGFQQLFNGTDLTGWDYNPKLWSVKDGVIVGKTESKEDLKYNEFLLWQGGEVKNFELRAKIKVLGKNNSGVQYRSKLLPEIGEWVVGGYQCDIHPNPPFTSMVYHEKGRGIMVQNGQSVITDKQGGKWLVAERDPIGTDITEWHEYTIIAQGNHITHKLDGQMTVELSDYDEANRALAGHIGIQIHRGEPMEVHIQSVELKILPDGGVTSFEDANVPSDAQLIEKKKPATKGKSKAKGKAKGQAKAPPAPAKAPVKKKSKRSTAVGARVGENKATPIERIRVPEGFEIELVYSVPGETQGSWVALCDDPQGRIYASDQYGVLYRFTPPAAGEQLQESDVERVPVDIRAINGMVWAFDALYVGVNDYQQEIDSGLYKISDTDGDDQLDKVELLRAMEAKGDHGVHAVLPTEDGTGLYLITGNNTEPTEIVDSSPVSQVWGDDLLLPRMPDGRGHNRHRLAPGGIIYKVSPDGKTFEAFSSGYRNIYDASLNADGELFTYDADMEYDFNTPWYRPTRVNHVVSGSEYGWRNGAGKYPEFYADNLPAAVNIGPGSPTGTTFGYGAKWPAKYQKAFYIFDWSWGKVYAVHLEEDGASYTGVKEDFISGAPLPVTDALIHPADGAMYFAIGGRAVQSGLYRLTYAGDESTEPVNATSLPNPLRDLRHEIEKYHGVQDAAAVDAVWPHLSHSDRFIRFAARVALQHQPVDQWAARALAESDATKQIEALIGLTLVTGTCETQRAEGEEADTTYRDRIFTACAAIDWAQLSDEMQLAYVRLVQIALHRFGDPSESLLTQIGDTLNAAFPADTFELNWLLCETLVYLQHPDTAAKGMALIAEAASQEPQMEYARSLRMLKAGWTPELREAQLNWFLKAANYQGGASFTKFIEFIRNDSLATYTDEEKATHAELIAKKPVIKSAIENLGEIFAGRTPKMWTLEELSAAAQGDGMTGRDYDTGRQMFTAAACYACHRFGNAGGMNGPDLTGAGGRYSPHDLLDSIIHPSKEINEQFAPIVVTKKDGSTVSGVVVNLNGNNVVLNTDLTNPNQRANIDRTEVESIEVSKVSPMPPNLLMMLKEDEVLDLLAYILSGGDEEHEMFAK